MKAKSLLQQAHRAQGMIGIPIDFYLTCVSITKTHESIVEILHGRSSFHRVSNARCTHFRSAMRFFLPSVGVLTTDLVNIGIFAHPHLRGRYIRVGHTNYLFEVLVRADLR